MKVDVKELNIDTLTNITFYIFTQIEDVNALKGVLDAFVLDENRVLRGKILVASEGVTGYMSGLKEDIKAFEDFIHLLEIEGERKFKDVWFKHNPTNRLNSKRMNVKIRKETITMKQSYDYSNTGIHLEPEELDSWYENNAGEFVIIDTRNEYEYEVGHFKDAIALPIKEFTEFPKAMNDIKDKVKGKKIVTYCTGGIRCEKATAWMRENGYEDVYQLNGGIINYGIKRGQGNWRGKCFVFDDRGAISLNVEDQKKELDDSSCAICYVPCEDTHKCPYCKNDFIMCSKCMPLLEGCCSKFCRNKMRSLKNGEIRSSLKKYEMCGRHEKSEQSEVAEMK